MGQSSVRGVAESDRCARGIGSPVNSRFRDVFEGGLPYTIVNSTTEPQQGSQGQQDADGPDAPARAMDPA
jgi:hypothetical protein